MKKTKIKFTTIKMTLLAVFASLVLTVAAQAATYTVNQINDSGDGTCDATCTLRDAILTANAAAGNDVIEFDAAVFGAPQTITLGGSELSITNNGTLTINGTGANQLTISGNNASRVFLINTAANAAISGITVTGGSGGSINTPGNGGGIFNLGALTLTNVIVTSNTAASLGGGISNFGSGSTLTLTNSTVSNNTATGNSGGGIYASGGGTLTVTDSTVSGNTSVGNGGGIRIFNGTAILTDSTVSGNSANGTGGGVSNSGSAALTNLIISDNTANNGGGASNSGSGSTLILSNSTVRGNSTVAGDPQTNAGGGLYNVNGGTLTVNDSTVSGNSTTNTGAGIYSRSSLTVNNSTVSGNTGSNFGGGGIRVEGGSSATLNNSTISNNPATISGGGLSVVEASTATLNNTIIANSPTGIDCFNSSSTINATYSLIESGTACVNGTNFGNLTGDPQLGSLQNNGGATETHALLAFSPAIDAGNSTLPTDQRGFPRPVDLPSYQNAFNAADIGAFELQQEYDSDGDGVSDNIDNCLNTANSDQADSDADGIGNACDADDDNDNIPDTCDVDQNPGAIDFDRDGIVDSPTCDTQIGPPVDKDQCKNDGWMRFNNPAFRNQGECVSFVESRRP